MHYYMWHMDTGENFISTSKRIFFVIRRIVLVPGAGVSVHSYFSHDASCAHRRGCGDK